MERIKELNRFQKGVLILSVIIVLIFTAVYPMTISRVGFAYKGAILVPSQENDSMVYTGKVRGKPARFTVSPDKTVLYQYADQTYGPYTATEDPTAIPEDNSMAQNMTGVELRCGQEIIFRGGIRNYGERRLVFYEDGSSADIRVTVVAGNGTEVYENGKRVDPMDPSAVDILNVMAGPTLTHKGQWTGWFYGVLLCGLTVISVLFADELFRAGLFFQIQNADQAEPSEWEIASRYVSWVILPILALAIFIMGLQ